MIGQACRHGWRAGRPFALGIIDHFNPQALVRTDPVVVSVFPRHGSQVQIQVFRESQGFADQTSTKETFRQVAPLDVGHALAQQFNEFILSAPNGYQFDYLQSTMLIPLFDHLQVKPILFRLRTSG